MYSKRKSYLTVLHYVAQFFALPEPETDLTMEDGDTIINVMLDSEWDIQVCLEDKDEEPLDGGWCVSMDDCTNIDKMTPEELSQLVTDKAEFIWELIHTS